MPRARAARRHPPPAAAVSISYFTYFTYKI
jgi:hypothetical protein